ncbi:MAG: helix-turn-helix transcriptional regulator [Clostridia bacterium]|nr:helix-turn-helix transcriptional regulator [Clostridia bacterium]
MKGYCETCKHFPTCKKEIGIQYGFCLTDYEPNVQTMSKEIRKALNLTQKKLATLLDTNQTEISFIERGFIPSNERIKQLTDYYENYCI